MRDELLGYYERELIFLRRMGAEFARKYPKVAGRLLLEEEKIEDQAELRQVRRQALRVILKGVLAAIPLTVLAYLLP